MKVYEHLLPANKEFKRDINIRVALPDNAGDQKLPMMILHDAQGFFDSWEGPETKTGLLPMLDQMFKEGFPPMAIVGIDTWVPETTHMNRFTDFSPWVSSDLLEFMPSSAPTRVVDCAGGRGDLYADFVVQDVIPFVESNYNIGGSPSMRGIGGHSMAGMASIYIGTKYNEYFTKFAFMSPALWVFKKEFKSYLLDIKPFKAEDKIYMDIGRKETSDPLYADFPKEYLEGADYIYEHLKNKCSSIMYYIDGDGGHEMIWLTNHLPLMLRYLWTK